MRRQRQDGVRVREIEPNALGGEPIERRRRGGAAIRPERVRAQRVDGDEEDVLTGDRPRSLVTATAGPKIATAAGMTSATTTAARRAFMADG